MLCNLCCLKTRLRLLCNKYPHLNSNLTKCAPHTKVNQVSKHKYNPWRSNPSSQWTYVSPCPNAHTDPNHQLSQPKGKKETAMDKGARLLYDLVESIRSNHTAANSDLPKAKLKCLIVYLLCILSTLKEILQSF